MLKKIKTKLKNFFSLVFDPKTKETGEIISTILVITIITLAIATAAPTVYKLAGRQIGEWLGDVGKGVLKGLVWFFYFVSKFLVDLAGNVLSSVLSSDFIRRSITKELVVTEGWKIVRNLANMFIVLGFVVVGIATILRIREYEAQKLLLPLILIAILINFSTVICGLIIDASNIIMNYFLTGGGGAGGIVTPITEALSNDADQRVRQLMDAGDSQFLELIGTYVGLTVFNVIAMITFSALALILLIRQVILMCLVVLAPLAFTCWVFNATKKIWSMWWENFVKWCFIGVGAIFFTYLAAFIISKGLFIQSGAGGSGGGQVQTLGSLGFLIPIIFLLVGLKITLGSSAMGATAAIGLAGGLAGFVGGKVMGAGKAVRGKTLGKDSRIGQKLGDMKSGMMERIGLAPAGSTAQREEKRGKEALGRMRAQYAKDPDSVLNYARGRQIGGVGPKRAENREAAAIVAAEEGKLILDPKDKKYNPRAIANYKAAATRGFDVKEAEKKNPELARFNDRKVNNIMTRPRPAVSLPLTRPQAEQIAVREKVATLAPGDYAKLSAKSITPEVLAASKEQQLAVAGKRGSPELINTIKKYKAERGKTLKEQTPEHQAIMDYIHKNLPKGSTERNNALAILKKIRIDANFV